MYIRRVFFHLKVTLICAVLFLLGFRFVVAHNKEEEDLSFALRYEIYGSEGFIDPDAYPDNRLRDIYDRRAIHILGLYRGKAVATARIVRDSRDGFPAEKLFNIKYDYPKERVAEVSGLGILPEFRSKAGKGFARLVMLGIAARIYAESSSCGIRYWFAVMPPKLAESFRIFGVDFEKMREYTLTKENKEARAFADGYFKKFDVHPYHADISAIPVDGLSFRRILERRRQRTPLVPHTADCKALE